MKDIVKQVLKSIDGTLESQVKAFAASNVSKREETYFKDPRDGKVYRTVEIGDQVWMAENMNYKIDNSWCYNNDEFNGKKYGRLYTRDAAKAVCPPGWHLPSRKEWNTLIAEVGGSAAKLKANSGWNNGCNGTDKYGFSALPGGNRTLSGGGFEEVGDNGYWWTVTKETEVDYYGDSCVGFDSYSISHYYYRKMSAGSAYVDECDTSCEDYGFSVRCVKNVSDAADGRKAIDFSEGKGRI
jgi:uncharacterized protein (TIGR02145 family)